MNNQRQTEMLQAFDFRGQRYEFKYFEEKGSDTGIFLIELSDDFLNHYTPRYFIICYKDHKVSFKAESMMDFDIKSAIVKTIIRMQETAA